MSAAVAPFPHEPTKASAELDISQMNPDADGDGKISKMEREIYNALKKADVDGSGSIGVKEVGPPIYAPAPPPFSPYSRPCIPAHMHCLLCP